MNTKTHRCIDCPQTVEHTQDELCPSCGRCDAHCHADNHLKMQPARFRSVGEGEAARMELVPPADYAKLLPRSRSKDA